MNKQRKKKTKCKEKRWKYKRQMKFWIKQWKEKKIRRGGKAEEKK